MNGNGKWLIKINFEKIVKERLEEIVKRGRIENQEEQILISTTALLYQFLKKKGDQNNREIISQLKERKKEVGFFFPSITEALLSWWEEGREDIPEKIRKLAASSPFS